MSRKILTVGLTLASDAVGYESFRERTSLLDWDITLFRPDLEEFEGFFDSTFQGRPSYNESGSFQLRECCAHWRREIKAAIDAGKTVFVFLPKLQEIYVDTGKRDYSGTGRNRQTTRLVDGYDNYKALPVELSPAAVKGSEMRLANGMSELLGSYWARFGSQSNYEVILRAEGLSAAVLTKAGDRVVGAIHRSKVSTGAIVLLPSLDFAPTNFFAGDDEVEWTEDARAFAGSLVASLLEIDKAIRGSSEVSPEPDWASDERFSLPRELELRSRLSAMETELEEAMRLKGVAEEELVVAGSARRLLFEKGAGLEAAIIDALQTFGFSADNYKDSNSEFDVVFESDEGRLIGEVEGKDTKAVNVDKLRQLAMNINEDLLRDEVDRPAKPVLFGNGYRLSSPEARPDQFTQKCVMAANQSSTALIATSEMFAPVQYLLRNPGDHAYKKSCRIAILSGVGPVAFPPAPQNAENDNRASSK